MCMAVAVSEDPVGALRAFRQAVYEAFGARRDALFDLLDALLTAGAVPSPVHLSLAPAHRRGWGSLYAALARGEISAAAVERLLAAHPLPADEAAEVPLYAVDGSVWARCDAETSPERGLLPSPLAPLERPADRRRLAVPVGGPGAAHARTAGRRR